MGDKQRGKRKKTRKSPNTPSGKKAKLENKKIDNAKCELNAPSTSTTDVDVGDNGSLASENIVNVDACNTSSSKITVNTEDLNLNTEDLEGYMLMDMKLFKHFVQDKLVCPKCFERLAVSKNTKFVNGSAHQLTFACTVCKWNDKMMTSGHITSNGKSQKPFDVNRRLVLAMKSIGKGLTGLEKFCGVMNMSKPITRMSYNNHNGVIATQAKVIGERSMKAEADKVRQTHETEQDAEGILNVDVSNDGSWQRRGFSSLNGVTTTMLKETGKCVDISILTKVCRRCQAWDNKKDIDARAYQRFLTNHNCKANFDGSAGAMEPQGIVSIYQRSITERKLRYINYIGDGDSKSYDAVCRAKPYGETKINKKECIGHVQKRLGGRLRKLKKSSGKKTLSDGKRITGKGRLSIRNIDLLQNYFGMAIRENNSSVSEMKEAIWASVEHCAGKHTRCPKGADSWCGSQRDTAKGTNSYRPKILLPESVLEAMKPTYEALTTDSLLEKCLHGSTQNANESLHHIIWNLCPKDVFVGRDTLESGVYMAVAEFNTGNTAWLELLKLCLGDAGVFSTIAMTLRNQRRVTTAEYKASAKEKAARKSRRRSRKGLQDSQDWAEIEQFGYGETD